MLTLSTRIVRSAEPLTAAVDNELVMLSPAQGSYFGLNEVGARIWELAAEPGRVDDLCATLAAEFDVDADTCRTEVIAFLRTLHQAKLVEVDA